MDISSTSDSEEESDEEVSSFSFLAFGVLETVVTAACFFLSLIVEVEEPSESDSESEFEEEDFDEDGDEELESLSESE